MFISTNTLIRNTINYLGPIINLMNDLIIENSLKLQYLQSFSSNHLPIVLNQIIISYIEFFYSKVSTDDTMYAKKRMHEWLDISPSRVILFSRNLWSFDKCEKDAEFYKKHCSLDLKSFIEIYIENVLLVKKSQDSKDPTLIVFELVNGLFLVLEDWTQQNISDRVKLRSNRAFLNASEMIDHMNKHVTLFE